MSSEEQPTYWVLLVGINYYTQGKAHDRPLRGAVPDIEDVEQMLQSYLEGKRLDITKITARTPDPSHEDTVVLLPDYETIVEKVFCRIQAEAKSGDFFYFHFSGHGGRQARKTEPGSWAGGAWYEVLILDGDRNLPDFELGALLDNIASRGVTIFAILDCCHSGGADRSDEDDGMRGLDEVLPANANIDILAESLFQDENQHYESTDEAASRDVSTKGSHWFRARDYTLLTACHPGEKAREVQDQGRWRGVLTSGMLRAFGQLTAAGGLPTYRVLYEIVRTGMIKEGYEQRCMLHGQGDRFLFGRQTIESVRVGTVRNVGRNVLQIDMGEIHGVSRGDEYEIYPSGAMIGENLNSNNRLAKIKISRVEATQSYAPRPKDIRSIKVGCIIKLVRPVIRLPLYVKVLDEKLLGMLQDMTSEEPSPFNPTLQAITDTSEAAFQVLSKDANYELADMMGTSLRHSAPIPGHPIEEAVRTVCIRLRRIARYRFVAGLVNKNSKLKKSFAFDVSPREVFDEDRVTITYQNLTKSLQAQDLYFTLFNLTSRGAVQLQDAGTLVEPGEKISDDVPMVIPPTLEDDEIEDVLVVVVTTEEPHMECLQSPGLHVEDSGSRGDEDDEEQAEDLADLLDSLDENSRDIQNRGISSWQTQQK
ncbi:hypothetical protein PENARI_c034G09889 [Penicillium arizonense]|uniref:Peptidase C14 caspase domain-containing protein n=1 Tax=Penicillium arizonense TaxID=1835702 RepID=A0A1F5L4W5_PENAI|nr:hypothetical protein PENARI_c034G09889 [Penicillium arizonense]OGE47969.1 hypothetical protein PENARI_c034G09889 [Penicillium arizonense]